MKFLPQSVIFILASLAFNEASAQQKEVTLSMLEMPVSYHELRTQANEFPKVYQGMKPFTGKQWESVRYTELEDVRKAISGTPGERYFAGLRVLHGLTDKNNIILYFMPVYANAASRLVDQEETFTLQEATGDLDSAILNTHLPIYYILDNHLKSIRGDEISTNEALDNSERYKRYVKTNIAYTDQQVLSNFFPFQELEALHNSNKTGLFSSDFIYFTSVTRKEDNGVYYHKIFVSTKPPTTNLNSEPGSPLPFFTQAGNFSHVCPPSCSTVSYQVTE